VAHTTARRPGLRISLGGEDGEGHGGVRRSTRPDTLAIEEPLGILVDGADYATTMRTPGHDLDLALGFLVSEGVIADPADVKGAAHCSSTSRLTAPDGSRAEADADHNSVTVDLNPHVPPPDPAKHRHVTSACGVCGTETVDAVRARSRYDLTGDRTPLDPTVLAALPDTMRASQKVFDRTGGLHAAALFDAAGHLLCLREDVGRHNAVDKVVGWAFTRGMLPLTGHVIQVSGRASFELVQKTWLAGAPALAAVSAPSSLAADLAEEAGMTLIGFSRGDHFSVYTGTGRITG